MTAGDDLVLTVPPHARGTLKGVGKLYLQTAIDWRGRGRAAH